jgi:hypothetical protein
VTGARATSAVRRWGIPVGYNMRGRHETNGSIIALPHARPMTPPDSSPEDVRAVDRGDPRYLRGEGSDGA